MEGASQKFAVKVLGLSYNSSAIDIKDFFNTFTSVTWVEIINNSRGQPSGIAIVQVKDEESVQKALAQNKCDFMGRYLNIERKNFEEDAKYQKDEFAVRVSGVSYDASALDIKDFFNKFTSVRWVDIVFNRKNLPSGICIVKLNDEESLRKALAQNKIEFMGRYLIIERATQEQIQIKQNVSSTVFVGNLSYDTKEDTLKAIFESCGKINSLRLVKDNQGKSKGFAYIEFARAESVRHALQKDDISIDNRRIKVDVNDDNNNSRGSFSNYQNNHKNFY